MVALFVLASGLSWAGYLTLISITKRTGLENVNAYLKQGEILQLGGFFDLLILHDWSIYQLAVVLISYSI